MVRGARKFLALGVVAAVVYSIKEQLNFVPGPRHAAPVAAAAASMMMAPAAFADEIGDASKKLGDASYNFAKEVDWNNGIFLQAPGKFQPLKALKAIDKMIEMGAAADPKLLKAAAEAHHKAIGSISGPNGVTSRADWDEDTNDLDNNFFIPNRAKLILDFLKSHGDRMVKEKNVVPPPTGPSYLERSFDRKEEEEWLHALSCFSTEALAGGQDFVETYARQEPSQESRLPRSDIDIVPECELDSSLEPPEQDRADLSRARWKMNVLNCMFDGGNHGLNDLRVVNPVGVSGVDIGKPESPLANVDTSPDRPSSTPVSTGRHGDPRPPERRAFATAGDLSNLLQVTLQSAMDGILAEIATLGGATNLVNTWDLLAGTNTVRNLHATGPLSIQLANDDWTLELLVRCVHHAADRRRHRHGPQQLLHESRRSDRHHRGGHRPVQRLHGHPAGRLQHHGPSKRRSSGTPQLRQPLAAYYTSAQTDAALAAGLVPYSTTAQMNQAIADALLPYGTVAQRDAAIAAALAAYYTSAQTDAAIAAAIAPYYTSAETDAAIAAAQLSNGQTWNGGPTFNLLRGSNVLRNLSVAGALTASFQNLDDTILIESDSYARSETYTQAETGAAITAAIAEGQAIVIWYGSPHGKAGLEPRPEDSSAVHPTVSAKALANLAEQPAWPRGNDGNDASGDETGSLGGSVCRQERPLATLLPDAETARVQGACFEMAVIVMCILWGLKQALKADMRGSPSCASVSTVLVKLAEGLRLPQHLETASFSHLQPYCLTLPAAGYKCPTFIGLGLQVTCKSCKCISQSNFEENGTIQDESSTPWVLTKPDKFWRGSGAYLLSLVSLMHLVNVESIRRPQLLDRREARVFALGHDQKVLAQPCQRRPLQCVPEGHEPPKHAKEPEIAGGHANAGHDQPSHSKNEVNWLEAFVFSDLLDSERFKRLPVDCGWSAYYFAISLGHVVFQRAVSVETGPNHYMRERLADVALCCCGQSVGSQAIQLN
ncbi:Peridinin-chlorophyll a-binding protein, chloroplastic [Symbiodinium microadriaticum]|uniref:Peridinin-chlorophyll a-binding protein, chloroplastic n=1 Tax=Symbiodinium microadriaticum TaxID=2951 RepID=A0A1Q9DMR8_SYMMI|nr:Peridinin-chlorophyll a-binding protein, chloroplastic [Symbiodinium microadriaticum]